MFSVRLFDPRTLSWWHDQREDIDFEPPYQRRGGLWSLRDQQLLIDSILNQYDIPKIYIADFTLAPSPLNLSNTRYAVIDGKQRLEAIFGFLDGSFALNDDFVLVEDPGLPLAGLSYRDLKKQHSKMASRIDNYALTVMSVVTDEEGRINQLFVRLNRNKTLTGPEIRNAMAGMLPTLFRDLASDPFFTDRVRFKTSRGQDLDVAAKFLLVEFRGELVETKRVALDRFVAEGNESDAKASDLGRASARVERVLAHMDSVFIHKDPLLSGQGQLVPYYWLVRASKSSDLGLVRPFLLDFETRRRANRKLATDPKRLHEVDVVLSRYDAFNRSINDPGSIEGRYKILANAFPRYATMHPGG